MAWTAGFEEIWTNAVNMAEARLERQLEGGAPPVRETVRSVLESVTRQWSDPDHFYGVWLRDFGQAHPQAASSFAAILAEMVRAIAPTYRVPSPLLPVGGGLIVGAGTFALLSAVQAGLAVTALVAASAGGGTLFAWWRAAYGRRRQARDQVVAEVSRALDRYGERLRAVVAAADRGDV